MDVRVTYEEALQKILGEIVLSREDRMSYAKDAEIIRNAVMERMKRTDPTFNKVYGGLSLGGSYLDDLKIVKPDEFDVHVILRPTTFRITLQRDSARSGILFLKSDIKTDFCVENGFVNRKKLQTWMRNILLEVFKNWDEVEISNGSSYRTYKLEYPKNGQGWAIAHTIIATDKRDKNRIISFDFVPAFEFDANLWPMSTSLRLSDRSWFTVPQIKKPIDNRTFLVCAPHWEREILKDKKNLKNSLRLMKALRDTNELTELNSYMLKTIYMNEIGHHPESFWEKSIGTILIYMFECLHTCLLENKISFYWEENLNHLDKRSKEQIAKYKDIVGDLVKYFKDAPYRTVSYREIRKLFIK